MSRHDKRYRSEAMSPDVMIGGMEAALKRPSSCEPVLLPVFHLRKYAGREYVT